MLSIVRTTLDIDLDVLQAAKDLAVLRKSTAGKVLSELARQALQPTGARPRVRNGVPVLSFAREGERPVTLNMVKRLQDDEPYE